ncbi:MAG: hypothetical protein NTY19_35450 [Planctomycetota bacterium]|nr:hypothetical protein [Planctomycetota bacterium]
MHAFHRHRTCFGLALLCWLATAVPARSAEATIQSGDTVSVAVERAELGLRDKLAVVLAKGDKLRVTEVRGAWIGGYTIVKGERQTGWLSKDEVQLVAVPPPVEAPVIAVPDQPDDPPAIAQLKTLYGRLELNPRGNVQSLSCSRFNREAETREREESEQRLAKDSDGNPQKPEPKPPLPALLSDAEAIHLRGLHQLSTLELSGLAITDAALEHIADCTTLQELYLDGTQITDQGLKVVQKLMNLEVLALQKTKITSAGLANLAGLKQLRVLNLSGCEITDEGLQHLAGLAALDTLALPDTQVTGAGLAHLKPLDRLRVLNLNNAAVDDAGLEQLMEHAELRMLYLKKTKVTAPGVKKLDDAVPGLAIYR